MLGKETVPLIIRALVQIGCFLAFTLPVMAQSEAQQGPSLAEKRQWVLEGMAEFLNRFPVISVPITQAPNHGHQSSNFIMIQRLRELGYSNQIEVLYDEDVRDKIETLFPGFKSKYLGEQNFPDQKLKFILFNPKQSHAASTAVLSISAGNDRPVNHRNTGAKILLRLQPLQWDDEHSVTWEIIEDGKLKTGKIGLSRIRNLGHVYSLPSPTDLTEFLNTYLSGTSDSRLKSSGLLAILESLDAHEMAPVYGHDVQGGTNLLRYIKSDISRQ